MKTRHWSTLLLPILSILLTASLAMIIINPNLAMKFHRKFFPQGPELRPFYHEMVSYQLRVDKNIPASADLFVGDSTIQSLCTPCVTPTAINFGIGRDTTLGVLHRLRQYESLRRAHSLFISVGINDFKYRNIDEIIRNYQEILSLTPHHTQVVVNAIWPVNPNIRKRWKGYPKQIETLNKALKQACSAKKRCHYFDIRPILTDKDGHLKRELQTGDGIHLNKAGYEIVITELKKIYNK